MSITTTKKETTKQVNWINVLCFSYLFLLLFCAFFAEWLPLSFSPTYQDLFQVYQKPFQWDFYQSGKPFHLLGTDDLGQDVGVNLIYGARTALLVSVPTIILAAGIGITLGLLAGYFGDSGLGLKIGKLIALLLALFFLCFYLINVTTAVLDIGNPGQIWLFRLVVVLLSLVLYKIFNYLLNQISFFRRSIKLPIDLAVLKLIELIGAVPRLLLILSLAAFSPEPSLFNVITLSMLTFWPGIARLTRAEILKIKNLPYIEAAVALGFNPVRVIMRHALPNMLVPLLVAITFGICNLIALEATLSFLGVGIPNDMASWGRSIIKIRWNYQAWWLVLFPGLAILFTVLSLQNINNLLIARVNPQKI